MAILPSNFLQNQDIIDHISAAGNKESRIIILTLTFNLIGPYTTIIDTNDDIKSEISNLLLNIYSVFPSRNHSGTLVPVVLFVEQMDGTALTKPLLQHMHTWIYKIIPSVKQTSFEPISHTVNVLIMVNYFSCSNPDISLTYSPNLQHSNRQQIPFNSCSKPIKLHQ